MSSKSKRMTIIFGSDAEIYEQSALMSLFILAWTVHTLPQQKEVILKK